MLKPEPREQTCLASGKAQEVQAESAAPLLPGSELSRPEPQGPAQEPAQAARGWHERSETPIKGLGLSVQHGRSRLILQKPVAVRITPTL